MALVNCKECGNQVSQKAKACPSCGAKPPQKTSLFTWFVLAFILYSVYASTTTSPIVHTAATKSNVEKSTTSTKEIQKSSVPSKPNKPISKWFNSSTVDEMTNEISYFARSVYVPPKRKMGFPYDDVKAILGVGCKAGREWAYAGFTDSPNLSDDETEDGYNLINTRIKWDESLVNVVMTQDWGSNFLHFESDSNVINNIANANSVLLELNWHGEGRVHFQFPLIGSTAALEKMRSNCS